MPSGRPAQVAYKGAASESGQASERGSRDAPAAAAPSSAPESVPSRRGSSSRSRPPFGACGPMVLPSRLAAGGLLLLLAGLALGLDGKPLEEAPAAASRLVRALRLPSRRMVRSEEPEGGPGHNSCFGGRLDRIGSVSGMGCGRRHPA